MRLLAEDEHIHSALVSIFNYLECTAIDADILDEKFMKSYLSGVCVKYLVDYMFYINNRRNLDNSSKIWTNFTNLAT